MASTGGEWAEENRRQARQREPSMFRPEVDTDPQDKAGRIHEHEYSRHGFCRHCGISDVICDCVCPCANRVEAEGDICADCAVGTHAPDLNGDTDDGEDYAEGFWT